MYRKKLHICSYIDNCAYIYSFYVEKFLAHHSSLLASYINARTYANNITVVASILTILYFIFYYQLLIFSILKYRQEFVTLARFDAMQISLS